MNILQESELGATKSCESNSPAGRERARMVAVVASVIPGLMVATIVVLRGGFVTPVPALLRVAGISLLVVNAAVFGSRGRWLLCGPLLSFYSFMGLAAIGLTSTGGRAAVGTLFACLGAATFFLNAVMVAARAGLRPMGALLILGLFLGLYSEGMYWQVYTVHDVVYPESILAGRVATDVAEQAAVVNMISTYRLASTGLDGLLPLKYHNGSLWIAEGMRKLCGFRSLDFLAYGYGVLLIPLYAAAFFGCAEVLRETVLRESGPAPFVFWAASTVAFVGVFPYVDDPLHLNFNEIVINSDSFLLAVTLSLLLIGAGARCYEWVRERDFDLNLGPQLVLAAMLTGSLILIGWVKISQIYLMVGLFFWLVARVKWMRRWPFLMGTAITLFALAAMLIGERGANLSRIAPFKFDRIPPEWVPYFFVFYFAWPWLLFVLWARLHRVQTVKQLLRAARAGETILVELAFVAVLGGLIPYLLIDFYSPAWKYFTEFQGLLAAVFVVALVPRLRWSGLGLEARDSLRISSMLTVGLGVAVCGHLFITTLASTYRMVKRGCETRAVLAGMPDTAWRQQIHEIRARRATVAAGFQDRVNMLGCLTLIGEQPLEQRRGVALYIPKTTRTYWGMRQEGAGTTPFIAPALASVPMVEGLPEYEDIGWARVGWGYPQYKLLTGPEAPVEKLDLALEKAREGGFRKLLVLRGVNAGGCVMQEIPVS